LSESSYPFYIISSTIVVFVWLHGCRVFGKVPAADSSTATYRRSRDTAKKATIDKPHPHGFLESLTHIPSRRPSGLVLWFLYNLAQLSPYPLIEPPCVRITALQRHCIVSIQFLQSLGVGFFYSSRITSSISSINIIGCRLLLILIFIICSRFSIGFRSGDYVGHVMRTIHKDFRYLSVSFEV
jgi:hypothetical protein